MDRAAQELLGTHDFGAFVATGAGDHRTRRIFRAECRREGHLVTIELEGSGFMRQMVRAIVGTLVRAGLGKLDPRGVRAILESQRRSLAGETAPACGLYLLDVRYPAAVGGELLEETE
jgi:tRNA pseudouridine38-40 synthase